MDKKTQGSSREVVFVIDEHPIVNFGLVELVKDLAPYARIRQFSTLKEAANRSVKEFPVLIVTDFYLKDVQNDAFVGLFETLFPDIPVLVTANDDSVMRQLIAHGSDRYVAFSKLTPFNRLTEIIRNGLVAAGVEVMPQMKLGEAVKPRHSSQSRIGVGGSKKPLTHKQIEVLEHVSAGLSNKDIAEMMHISVETVKGHVKDILERLEAKNRMEASMLYRHALRQGSYELDLQ